MNRALYSAGWCINQSRRAKRQEQRNRREQTLPRRATHDLYLLVYIVEQNLIEIVAIVLVITLSTLINTYDAPKGPLCVKKMTSSTTPEVHNVSQLRQRKTEPRLQSTCTANLVKFGYAMWFLRYTSGQTRRHTDRHTDRHTHHNTSHLSLAK